MSDTQRDTFVVVVNALSSMLADASERATEARGYMCRHERNAAIGTLLGLETVLSEALALYRVALLLHRRSDP